MLYFIQIVLGHYNLHLLYINLYILTLDDCAVNIAMS